VPVIVRTHRFARVKADHHESANHPTYISVAFGQRCTKMGVRPTMGSIGGAYDNAMAKRSRKINVVTPSPRFRDSMRRHPPGPIAHDT